MYKRQITVIYSDNFDEYYDDQDEREQLFNFLAHGTAEHKRWLRDAINAFFDGDNIPPPVTS